MSATDVSALDLVHEIFVQLLRRRFALGPADLGALRRALAAGFGWTSPEDLRDLIISLWAKSTREAAVIHALFTRLQWPMGWTRERLDRATDLPTDFVQKLGIGDSPPKTERATPPLRPQQAPPVTRPIGAMPLLTLGNLDVTDARLVFVEQFPLTHREIAQAFRRLRRPLRSGPPVELDVSTTIARRAHAGVSVPLVLVAPRRNTSHLLLFVDVEGSMAPYRPFVTAFCDAVREAGWLQRTRLLYFHDVPTGEVDHSLLDDLAGDGFFPPLDPILARVQPLVDAEVFYDEALTQQTILHDVLIGIDAGTVAVIVSDAGAARGRSDLARLMDSVAFVKALHTQVRAVAWLNPVPQLLWTNTNAARLMRHVPMFTLDRIGIHQAVNALRGHPVSLDRPL